MESHHVYVERIMKIAGLMKNAKAQPLILANVFMKSALLMDKVHVFVEQIINFAQIYKNVPLLQVLALILNCVKKNKQIAFVEMIQNLKFTVKLVLFV